MKTKTKTATKTATNKAVEATTNTGPDTLAPEKDYRALLQKWKSTDIENTFEILFVVEYNHSNPCGYLNLGGAPYVHPYSRRAAASGESLKRKMRNFIEEYWGLAKGFDIAIRSGPSLVRSDGRTMTLEDQLQQSRSEAGFGFSSGYTKRLLDAKKGKKKASPSTENDNEEDKEDEKSDLSDAHKLWIEHVFNQRCIDRRLFGYVDVAKKDQFFSAKGPFCVHDAESVHPVEIKQISNTRQMVTSETERLKRSKSIANRDVLRYALMRTVVTVSPAAARITGMTMHDLRVALHAIIHCWPQDTAPRRRGVFKDIWMFKCPRYGRRPVGHDWTDVIEFRCKLDDPTEANDYSDFEVIVHHDLIPEGVELLDTKAVLDFIGTLSVEMPEAAE